ncbi:MAG: hypothetical protein D6714_11830 [Bacteroidetes bacterium]|nr:MAG: hypothetical protein D6714_11830 [Bacteroidota bacterium]
MSLESWTYIMEKNNKNRKKVWETKRFFTISPVFCAHAVLGYPFFLWCLFFSLPRCYGRLAILCG